MNSFHEIEAIVREAGTKKAAEEIREIYGNQVYG